MQDAPDPQTSKLIRLKRYERPPDGYFERFLDEFHRRQRADWMHRSSLGLFLERLGAAFSDFMASRLVFAGGALAAVALAFLITKPTDPAPPATITDGAALPPDFEQPKGQVTPVSAEGATVGSGKREPALTRYPIVPRPDTRGGQTLTFEL